MSSLNAKILARMGEASGTVLAVEFFRLVEESDSIVFSWRNETFSVKYLDNRRYYMHGDAVRNALRILGRPYYSGPTKVDLIVDMLALSVDVTIETPDLLSEFYIKTLVDQALARTGHAGELIQVKISP